MPVSFTRSGSRGYPSISPYGGLIPPALSGLLPLLLAAALTLGCSPDEVCPGGSVEDGDRCLLVGADANFPSESDGAGVTLADTAAPDIGSVEDGTGGETEQKDGSNADDDVPAGPTDDIPDDASQPDPSEDVGTDPPDTGSAPPDDATDSGGGAGEGDDTGT